MRLSSSAFRLTVITLAAGMLFTGAREADGKSCLAAVDQGTASSS